MTQPGAPYPQPQQYPHPYPYPPVQRPPAAIKTFGIINLVFAGLGAIGGLFTWAMYFGDLRLGPRNPVVEIAHESPAYMRFLEWSVVVGFFAVAVLAASGVGLLKSRMWGRKLAIGYSLYAIVGAIVGLVMTQHYVMGPLSRSHEMAASAGAMGGYMGGALGVAYPLVLLIFMCKRNVVTWLQRVNEPPVPPARVV